MESVKISSIVPIYNAVSNGRLRKLLNCLKNQTIKEIEFILVFDSPTDNSIEEAKIVIGNDNRFIFIENDKNLHIGRSRNKGLSFAKGEYVAFADDDDLLKPDMYKNLYEVAKKNNADVVVSPAIFNNQGEESIEFFDYDAPDLQQYFIDRLVGEISEDEKKSEPYPYLWGNGNMWNKIFRRSVIVHHHIQFVDTRYCCFEDVLFQLEFFCNAVTVVSDPTPYYTHIYYNNRSNTSMSEGYNSDLSRCNFLSNLLELHLSYPERISKDRTEKKVLDTLMNIYPRVLNHSISTAIKLQKCFKSGHLNYLIGWYPSYIREYVLKTKMHYLHYIIILKILLIVSYGKNICSLR